MGGRKPALIAIPSREATIIADCIEKGDSIKMAQVHVNTYRRDCGKEELGWNPVYSCYLRLKPQVRCYQK